MPNLFALFVSLRTNPFTSYTVFSVHDQMFSIELLDRVASHLVIYLSLKDFHQLFHAWTARRVSMPQYIAHW